MLSATAITQLLSIALYGIGSSMNDSTGYHHNSRAEMLEFIPASCQRLLDVGCHAGDFGAYVKERRHAEVWGLDSNLQALELAKVKLDHAIGHRFDETADVPDHYFDVITFNDVLEHFSDPAPALQLCKRKLRPGGVVVCSIPNIRHIDNLEHLLFEMDWRYEESGIRDQTHLRFFTKKSIVRTMEINGFDIVTIIGINPRFWSQGKYWRRAMFRLMPGWTDDMKYIQFAVVARPRGQ